MQKPMLQLGVVPIAALITERGGMWDPITFGWRRKSSRYPARACGLLAILVTVLGLTTAVWAAQALCQVPSNAYLTIQAAVNDATCATIRIAAGTYPELVVIARDVTIRGAGQESTIVDGDYRHSVFTIASGMVTIKGMTIQHGGSYTCLWGGGIDNAGTLTIRNSTLTENYGCRGGAIRSEGTLTIQKSTFAGNGGDEGGGAIWNASGTLTIQNSTFTRNGAGSAGGAIRSEGTLTIRNSTFAENSAYDGAGAIDSHGTLIVENSIISGNRTVFGAALWSAGGAIEGDRMLIVNSTISGNSAMEYGGGIYIYNKGTLTIQSSTIAGNSADFGGAIYSDEGTLTIQNSTLADNSADSDGGGIFNVEGGTVVLTRVTFQNNIPNDCTGCP